MWETPMKLDRKGRKAKVGTEKIVREARCMYYLDKARCVARTKIRNA
jgi:hypothetical protein